MTPQSKPHFKILLIGKTGAGKTTAINMLFNLIQKKKYEDERTIAITQTAYVKVNNSEQQILLQCNIDQFMDRQSDLLQSSSLSQTKDCNMYTIESENVIITLVDTPGIGDTGGSDEDDKHIKTIVSRVQQLTEINAIMYVHRASDIRGDLYLKYYVNSLRGMLTKSCQENFIICYTGVVNSMKIDAEQVLKEIGMPCENSVYFENDCLTPITSIQGVEKMKISQQTKIANVFWQQNQEYCEELLKIIEKMRPQQTRQLLDLLVKKESIIKIACEKQRQIKQYEQEKINIQQTKKSYTDVEKQLQSVGPLTKQIPVVKYKSVQQSRTKTIKKKLDQKITFCFNCLNKCHNPCYLKEVYARGSYELKGCTAFCGGEKCKCGHTVDYHGHTNEITEEVKEYYNVDEPYTVYENVTDNDKVQRKTTLEKEKEKVRQNICQMEQQLQQSEQQISIDLRMIVFLHEKIKETSLYTINDTTVQYLESQIEQAKKDPNISVERRNILIQNFTKHRDNYLIIKQQVQEAQNQNLDTNNIDSGIQNQLKNTLDQTEREVMQSIQQSINYLYQQQPNQKKSGGIFSRFKFFS